MQRTPPLMTASYEVLAVRPPNDRASNVVRNVSLALLAANATALALSYAHLSRPVETALIGVVETLSTEFFAAEYALRLWSAAGEPGFRSRLRFALRPLSLIDLAALLPLPVA